MEVEKPKKKKTASTNSLVSIPNQIKLSMLNSGLLSFGEFLREFYFQGMKTFEKNCHPG